MYAYACIIHSVATCIIMKPPADRHPRTHRREAITSQEQLRERLQGARIEATQATLSRDIRDLGWSSGRPTAPTGAGRGAGRCRSTRRRGFAGAVDEYLRGATKQVEQLMVLRTDPGQAQALAVVLDRARTARIVGTIAGDDTILVICRIAPDARRACRRSARAR